MNPMLIPLIVTMTTIAMVVYVLKKETNLLGKKYNKEYETDFTKGLGWSIWSYLWWAGCGVSMFMSFVRDDWGYSNIFLLWIGTTLLYAALVAAWSVIRKDRVDAIYSTNKTHTPEEIFEAIGAEIKEKGENKDASSTNYLIAYQGGYFTFTFTEGFRWADITYFAFESCKYEYVNKILMEVNSLNYNLAGWNCYLSLSGDENEEKPLNANLSYRLVLNGSLAQIKTSLKELLEQAFHVARDFSAELKEKIKKQKETDDEFFNNKAFNNRIAYIQRMKEIGHLDEQGEEFLDSSILSVESLVKYFDNTDFGCLQNMRIVKGHDVEEITELDKIQSFDIREYIRKQSDAASIKNISFIIGFEYQELLINLTKASGSTDKTLFYIVNIVCSGSELDGYMENRFPNTARALMEIRLTNAEQDYWEAKYMIDEAMDKSKSGNANELTDEQRLVLTITQPSLQLDLYWGKKYYNKQCYFQALYHFNRVFKNLRSQCKSWDDEMRALYEEICYYIGFIYTDLKMYDRAFYYLWPAQSNGRISGTQEFVNCLCNMKDVGAKGYISSKAKEVTDLMNKDEEEAEHLLPLYNFLRRRYIYAMIDRDELDEAEEMLNEMIKGEQDLEFANGELEYIKAIRENRESENQ